MLPTKMVGECIQRGLVAACVAVVTCLSLVAPTPVAADDTTITGNFFLITNVSATSITQTSATISWQTNDNATSQVFYDTEAHTHTYDYTHSIAEDTNLVTAHSVTLTGLTSSTTYHYRVRSATNGTESVSGDDTFTTLAAGGGVGGGGSGGGSGGVTKDARLTSLSGAIGESGKLFDYIEALSLDNKLRLYIPSGTFARNRNNVALWSIRITTLTEPPEVSENMEMMGLAYELTPAGANLNPSATLSIRYDTSEIPQGISEKNLVVAAWDEVDKKWIEFESTVDPKTRTISTKIDRFAIYMVMARAHPANFTIADLEVNPGEVTLGESISISVLVTNTGDLIGSYQATLKIDNEAVATEDVTLVGGASQTVTFTTAKDVAGTYSVNVNGLSGTFTIKEARVPATFTTSALKISPTKVDRGKSVTISVLITNTSDLTGSHQVTLKINNKAVATKDVTLAGGTSQTVTFTTAKDVAGTYSVNVNGMSGTFTVKRAPAPTAVPAKPANWWLIGCIIAALVVIGLNAYVVARKRIKAKTTSIRMQM
jgi:hypothetical protein